MILNHNHCPQGLLAEPVYSMGSSLPLDSTLNCLGDWSSSKKGSPDMGARYPNSQAGMRIGSLSYF